MSQASDIADALRAQESGGGSDPDLLNQSSGSGARGPWQIMPANWPSWARSAGLTSDAPWTLANQKTVVMNQIQRHLDAGYSPEDIAAIWYSGQPLGDNADASQPGGPSIRSYVNSVMANMSGGGRAPLADQAVPSDTPQNSPWQPGAGSVSTFIKALSNSVKTGRNQTPNGTTPGPNEYQRTGDFDKDGLSYANQMLDSKAKIDKWIQQHTGENDAAGDPVGYVFDPKTGLVESVKSNGYDAATGPKYIYTPIAEPSVWGSQYKNAQDNLNTLSTLKQMGLVTSGIDSAKAYVAADKEHGAEATRQLNDFITRVSNLVSLENVPVSRAQTLAQTMSDIDKGQKSAGPNGFSAPQLASKPQFTDLTSAIKSLAGTVSTAPQPFNVPASDFTPGGAAVTKPNPNQTQGGGAAAGVPPQDPNQILRNYGFANPGEPGALTGGYGGAAGQVGAGVPTPNQGNIDPSPQIIGGQGTLADILRHRMGAFA